MDRKILDSRTKDKVIQKGIPIGVQPEQKDNTYNTKRNKNQDLNYSLIFHTTHNKKNLPKNTPPSNDSSLVVNVVSHSTRTE